MKLTQFRYYIFSLIFLFGGYYQFHAQRESLFSSHKGSEHIKAGQAQVLSAHSGHSGKRKRRNTEQVPLAEYLEEDNQSGSYKKYSEKGDLFTLISLPPLFRDLFHGNSFPDAFTHFYHFLSNKWRPLLQVYRI